MSDFFFNHIILYLVMKHGKHTPNDYRSMSKNSEHTSGQAAISNHTAQVSSNKKAEISSSDDSKD